MVVVGLNEDKAQRTVDDIASENGEAWFVRTDVPDASDVRASMESAVEEVGNLDMIFDNAGAERSGAVTDFNESEWDLLIPTIPRSCFLSAKYEESYLRKREGGSI